MCRLDCCDCCRKLHCVVSYHRHSALSFAFPFYRHLGSQLFKGTLTCFLLFRLDFTTKFQLFSRKPCRMFTLGWPIS